RRIGNRLRAMVASTWPIGCVVSSMVRPMLSDKPPDDKTLRDEVEQELEWDPKVDASNIGVIVKNGAVTLTGHVSTYTEKLAAVRAAERVYGVKAVADEIEVRPSGS